jgi:trk system potassium uptake protein TrkA
VNGFLNFLRKGNVVATASVAGDTAEVLEACLSANSPLLDIPLMEIKFSAKIILLAVMRDEKVFIPNGSTRLQVDDHVIFMGEHKEIRSIDHLLAGTEEE